MALPPHTAVVLLAAVVGSGIGLFVWLFRDVPGARPLAVFMFAASVWSLGEGISLVTPGLTAKLFWTKILLTVSPLMPVAWLATVIAYTGRDASLGDRRLWSLGVEPVTFLALVWTNGAHHLVWESVRTVAVGGFVALSENWGVAFWAHTAYSYALIAAGALLLVRSNYRTNSRFRSQNTVLLVAIFIPLLTNALSVFGVLPALYDLTSVGFVLSGAVIAGALYNWNILRVAPATRELGRETLIDQLDDQVLILDSGDCIVDLNPAAADLFAVDQETVIGKPLDDFQPDLAGDIADIGTGQASLELAAGEGLRYFDVRVTSLSREGSVVGRLVSLRDVTERQYREQRLDVLNRLLRHNLRNEMNVVRGNVELLLDELDDADETALERLVRVRDTVDTVVARSDKVGRVSRLMDSGGSGDRIDLSRTCSAIVETVRRKYPRAEIETDLDPDASANASPSVRFAIEELVRNAIEHNDSERPLVTVATRKRDDGFVSVDVTDDGPGIPETERSVIEAGRETDLKHGSGVGLWLVSWVVRTSGGRVDFRNHDDATGDGPGAGERGCTVSVRLPAENGSEAGVEPR